MCAQVRAMERFGRRAVGRDLAAGVVLTCAFLLAAGALLTQPVPGGPAAAAGDAVRTVRLEIDYGNGVEKHYTALVWRAGMTVLDALRAAAELRPGLELRSTGSGETAFVTSIDGFENSSGAGGRNWVYTVNGELARQSCGLQRLSAGDVVRWKFDSWNG